MKKVQQIFGEPIDDEKFRPHYFKERLIPEELDFQRYKLLSKTDDEVRVIAENIRVHLLNLWNNGHGVFSRNENQEEIIREIKELISHEVDKYYSINNGKIYLAHGNYNVANQWFPEMSDVKVNNKSLIDQLRDPEVFYRNFYDIMIKDRHKHGEKSFDNNWISDNLIDSMRIVSGFQPVFNFPATLSKLIYLLYFNQEKYRDMEEVYVFDGSFGWAGRMTGLLAAFCTPLFDDVKVHYHGTDVNTNTTGRFEEIREFWNYYISSRIETDFDLYRSFVPAEDIFRDKFFSDMKGKYDFAFTSPPYYSNEQYSDDEEQSYKLYKTYPEWRDGFLKGMIKNTYDLLKPGAQFWLNIADVNTNKGKNNFYPLEADSVAIAKECGFEHVDTYYMTQHQFPGNDSAKNIVKLNTGKKKKFEPIFIFQKKD